MSELISCVEIHIFMHAFICLTLCVARSSVVSLQVINIWKYIQSTFVLAPLIQGIQIGFYAWTLVLCTDLMASSPCCTWKPINDNTQQPKQHHHNTIMNETQGIVFKNVFTLKASFGAKPNVLQFCPLSDVYVVNVIQPLCTLFDVQPLYAHRKSTLRRPLLQNNSQ